ncbi:uncharacterized protein LOC113204584 isoform X2 [Frankliniella occidentalis]|uniref:Uncharacterized protein LOC113204584 isoform X2 n=1 Tax=Frankliniella occidentalis TaxID=133901 RepID=A0A9C6WWC9_FRAOC|nr:uncharacterized protein LOC113204584 isoform X2 [Frankliniella occidentalis]
MHNPVQINKEEQQNNVFVSDPAREDPATSDASLQGFSKACSVTIESTPPMQQSSPPPPVTKPQNCCARCRGHGRIAFKTGHGTCPYELCRCVFCCKWMERGMKRKMRNKLRRNSLEFSPWPQASATGTNFSVGQDPRGVPGAAPGPSPTTVAGWEQEHGWHGAPQPGLPPTSPSPTHDDWGPDEANILPSELVQIKLEEDETLATPDRDVKNHISSASKATPPSTSRPAAFAPTDAPAGAPTGAPAPTAPVAIPAPATTSAPDAPIVPATPASPRCCTTNMSCPAYPSCRSHFSSEVELQDHVDTVHLKLISLARLEDLFRMMRLAVCTDLSAEQMEEKLIGSPHSLRRYDCL